MGIAAMLLNHLFSEISSNLTLSGDRSFKFKFFENKNI